MTDPFPSIDATEHFATPTVTYDQLYAEGVQLNQHFFDLVSRDEVACNNPTDHHTTQT